MQRYFLNENPTQQFQLPADVAHHFVTVLRANIDDQAEFVLPDQKTVVLAKLVAFKDEGALMEIITEKTIDVELPVAVTLVLGLAKGDKPELVVQKGTELGASQFIFVETDWSVVHWGNKVDRKLARLRKIAQGAAEQSHRLVIPTVTYVAHLQDINLADDTVKVVAWEESAKQGETAQFVQAVKQAVGVGQMAIMFGPEGGLKETELASLTARGFVPVGLGPRILRAETAPLYALSALSYATELERNGG